MDFNHRCPKCDSPHNLAPIGRTLDGRIIWKDFGSSNSACGFEWLESPLSLKDWHGDL